MRVLLALFVVLLAHAVVADDQVLSPLSGVPNNVLSAVPCTTSNCPKPAAKPMKVVKVEKAPNPFCDCIMNPICDCRKVATVEPELKEKVFCGCLASPGDCPCRPSNYQLIKDSCGCLHLQVCPCRMEFIEPETRERHLEPELKDRKETAVCGCLAEAACPCRVQTVTPEIKDPCACLNVVNTFCACAPQSK